MGLQNRLISFHTLCCATPRKMPDVGDLEIVLEHLLFLDTC